MATVKKGGTSITYEKVVRDIRAGFIKPVYYLIGEESYFIDRISNLLSQTLLTDAERDFNQITLFGMDVDVAAVINAAKSFPMGAKHLVVIVKEAQHIRDLDKLSLYLQSPQPTTVLIVCHKNGTVDRRKKLYTLVEKAGVLFESSKYRDAQLPEFIRSYLAEKGFRIEERAVAMLSELVGTDLSRMAGELDKLIISHTKDKSLITASSVEATIGLSKEFNYFELQDAITHKNSFRAFQIAQYFGLNPKANPLARTLEMLFRFFSRLMLAYYAPNKSSRGIGEWVGMTDWQVEKNILPAMKNYKGVKVMKIISEIRKTDAHLKGVDYPKTSEKDLLRELMAFILH